LVVLPRRAGRGRQSTVHGPQ